MSTRPHFLFMVALLSWLYVAHCFAGVRVTFPLGGYYRPGKFVPVRVEAEGVSGQTLEISAEGAAPTRLSLTGGRLSGVFPLLAMEALGQPGWRIHGGASGLVSVELKPLALDQRLVGFESADTAFAQSLFADATIVPVQLDPADALPGKAIAWEALDAIVLNSLPAKWDDQSVNTFLSAGTVIAIRSPAAPDKRWPWKQRGSYWVLSHTPAGPMLSAEDPRLFEPVAGWTADWPKPYRMRVILFATATSIVILGASLWRSRRAWVLMVLLCAAGTFGIAAWRNGKSPVQIKWGTVIVDRGTLRQYDWMHFYATVSGTPLRLPLDESTRLFFETRADWLAAKPALLVRADGSAEFELELQPAVRVATLSRNVMHDFADLRPMADENSPMARLARKVYLRPGDQLSGEDGGTVMIYETQPENVEEFPTVWIRPGK